MIEMQYLIKKEKQNKNNPRNSVFESYF